MIGKRAQCFGGRWGACAWALVLCMVVIPAASADETKSPISDALQSKCLITLRNGIRSDEFWPAMHAAEGLTLAGHGGEVVELLAPKMKTVKDDQQRCGVARELARAGDMSATAVLFEVLDSAVAHGHTHAAESLFKVDEMGDGRALRRAWAQTENIKLRLMAAAALARGGNPAAMKWLREKLADPDLETSKIAAWILGQIGSPDDIAQLRKNLGAAPDDLTRCYIDNALAMLGDEGGLKALARNLAHDDPAVRTYAANFAGDARAASVVDQLTRLLDDDNLDVRVRSAQSLLVLAQPPPPDPREDISRLAFPATKEHPRYTEGSIVRLNDGSLLYAVSQFSGDGSDFARASIVARTSRDDGRTWGEPRVLQESTGKMNVMSVTLRRLNAPAPAGTIAMFYLEKNAFDDLPVYVRLSRDEGATFGQRIRVSTEPGYHVMNNDRVTQLSSGRLLAPVASTADVHKVNHFVSFCWISDDGGQTWRKGKEHVDQPKRGAMEPEVIELDDRRVLMIMRTQLGHIATSYSADGGETWSEPGKLSVKSPEAPATLRRIPSTGDLLLIWNNTFTPGAGHGGQRTPLTAAISTDEGKAWRQIRNLETDADKSYAYTSLIFVGHRAVMTYWESGPGPNDLSSRFRSLPISWFYE